MFEIKKFFNGFAFWKGEQLGKILFIGILIAVGLGVYHQITRPTQSQKIIVQKGAVQSGGKLEVCGQKQTENKHWVISGIIQSDKTIGFSIGYMF